MNTSEEKPTPRAKQRFGFKGRIASFGYAFNGLWLVVRSEHNAWIHLFAGLIVISAGFILNISRDDWTWMVLAIGWVWAAELINTALEKLCDAISPEHHPLIGASKDIAAGAVLISAIGAALIGAIRFWPYLAGTGGSL